MANDYYTFEDGRLWKHHVEEGVNRNTFYGDALVESSITAVLNENPNIVKIFNTLSYEGTQGKVISNNQDGNYTILTEKKGWYVNDIQTDIQEGMLSEFVKKEGKWFNYIRGKSYQVGKESAGIFETPPDLGSFNFQGLGISNNIT